MTKSESRRFHGIYPSVLCPLRPDYTIDEEALARHVGSLAEMPGIVGILCNGHAGENFLLTRLEKRRVVEVTRAAIGRESLLVAGVSQEDSTEAAAEAREAEAMGADAVMVFAPFSWALAQDELIAVRHHRAVIAATGLPVMLFQGSVKAGCLAYRPEVLRKLIALPNVVAIKEGSWETSAYEVTRRLVGAEAPDIAVMASGDEHLLPCFVLGSEGSLVSLAALIPEVIVAMDSAVRAGNLPAARTAHGRVYPLARAIYGAAPSGRVTARLKACLHLLGRLPNSLTRPPCGPLPREEICALEAVLAQTVPL